MLPGGAACQQLQQPQLFAPAYAALLVNQFAALLLGCGLGRGHGTVVGQQQQQQQQCDKKQLPQ
jgi:hypothetical protein